LEWCPRGSATVGLGRKMGDVFDDVFVMTDAVDDDDAELEIPETQ